MEKSIKKDSVIVTFSEFSEEFHIVHLFILNGPEDFFLITKSIPDCFLDEHVRALKIFDTETFHWEIIQKTDLGNCAVSDINKPQDGFFTLPKISCKLS